MNASGSITPHHRTDRASKYKVKRCLRCEKRFKARIFGERSSQSVCDPCQAINNRNGVVYSGRGC